MTALKNMFYQLEEVLHTCNPSSHESQAEPQPEPAPEFFSEIIAEAMGIEKFFLEMDRKKEEIMSKLGN
jgi:hypothetical protein